MRFAISFVLFSLIYCAASKNNVKALTESMGQEVIELGDPIKELPPGLDEEPSAEHDDEEKMGANTLQPATMKETRIPTTLSDARRKLEEKSAGVTEDEETKIEKQLAELYRDAPDYKADSSEKDPKESTSEIKVLDSAEDKPVARQRSKSEFKFQPDVTNKAAIEKFRTSVDEINCDRRVTQKLADKQEPEKETANSAVTPAVCLTQLLATVVALTFC